MQFGLSMKTLCFAHENVALCPWKYVCQSVTCFDNESMCWERKHVRFLAIEICVCQWKYVLIILSAVDRHTPIEINCGLLSKHIFMGKVQIFMGKHKFQWPKTTCLRSQHRFSLSKIHYALANIFIAKCNIFMGKARFHGCVLSPHACRLASVLLFSLLSYLLCQKWARQEKGLAQ